MGYLGFARNDTGGNMLFKVTHILLGDSSATLENDTGRVVGKPKAIDKRVPTRCRPERNASGVEWVYSDTALHSLNLLQKKTKGWFGLLSFYFLFYFF